MPSQSTPHNLYQQKMSGFTGEIHSLRLQINETENRVNRIDNVLAQLPARISSVRQMNYRLQTGLEDGQKQAAERWAAIGPSMKMETSTHIRNFTSQLDALERDINALGVSSTDNPAGLTGIDLRVNSVKDLISSFSSRIDREIMPLESILSPLEKGVAIAENVVKLTSAASFSWREGESPVMAVHAKDMNSKTDGILTLTNQRIIFESEKEIILKKVLFVATEKKVERTLTLERPIGSIHTLTRGRVGILAGAGLFIDFKQGDPQLKLDVTGGDADLVVSHYGLITTGQIDRDLNTPQPVEGRKAEHRVVSCLKCGAPYTKEIYRGQLTVQCTYCGTVITVQ